MAQERLVKYILRFAEKGYTLKDIRARLLRDGWNDTEIQEAVKVVREELKSPKTSDSQEPEKFKKSPSKKKSAKKKTSSVKKTSKKSGVKGMATWKKRLIIILSIIVLLAVGILAAFLIFS